MPFGAAMYDVHKVFGRFDRSSLFFRNVCTVYPANLVCFLISPPHPFPFGTSYMGVPFLSSFPPKAEKMFGGGVATDWPLTTLLALARPLVRYLLG